MVAQILFAHRLVDFLEGSGKGVDVVVFGQTWSSVVIESELPHLQPWWQIWQATSRHETRVSDNEWVEGQCFDCRFEAPEEYGEHLLEGEGRERVRVVPFI